MHVSYVTPPGGFSTATGSAHIDPVAYQRYFQLYLAALEGGAPAPSLDSSTRANVAGSKKRRLPDLPNS